MFRTKTGRNIESNINDDVKGYTDTVLIVKDDPKQIIRYRLISKNHLIFIGCLLFLSTGYWNLLTNITRLSV